MKPPVVKRDLVLPTGVRQAIHPSAVGHSEESGSTPRISLLPKCNLHTFGANTMSLSKGWTVISRFMLSYSLWRRPTDWATYCDQTNHDIQQYPFGVTSLITHIFPADSFMEYWNWLNCLFGIPLILCIRCACPIWGTMCPTFVEILFERIIFNLVGPILDYC